MTETNGKRGRDIDPEVAAERRRRWRELVEESGLLSEQIAYAIKRSISEVWSYADGAVPPVSAINALAKRNARMAEAETIHIGFDDE